MIRRRVTTSLALATAMVCAGSILKMPIASASPLDGIRAAVVNARAGAPCAALNYNIALKGKSLSEDITGLRGRVWEPGITYFP